MALLAPRVIGPLSEASTVVRLKHQRVGGTVEMLADGVAHVGGGPVGAPDERFPLYPGVTLSAGSAITARQRHGSDTSPISSEPVVVQAALPVTPVAFRSRVHVCGGCVWVHGAVPGAEVAVTAGGVESVTTAHEGQARVGLGYPPHVGEVVAARQSVGGLTGGTVTVTAHPLPVASNRDRLPPPSIVEPLVQCDSAVSVANVLEGLSVTLERTGGSALTACFDASALAFGVYPLMVNEELLARQAAPACEIQSDPSTPVVVQPAEPLLPSLPPAPAA